MRWFGARLALLALWLQLALSFGHIHPSDVYRLGHPVVQDHGAAVLVAPGSPASEAPGAPGNTASSHQACAICANMALAGSALPADPAKFASPVAARAAPPGRDGAPVLASSSPYLLFRTRAPPSA